MDDYNQIETKQRVLLQVRDTNNYPSFLYVTYNFLNFYIFQLERDLYDMVDIMNKKQTFYISQINDLHENLGILNSINEQNKAIMEKVNSLPNIENLSSILRT